MDYIKALRAGNIKSSIVSVGIYVLQCLAGGESQTIPFTEAIFCRLAALLPGGSQTELTVPAFFHAFAFQPL